MILFQSCRYNTGPISETKIGSEHFFETGIFKGIKFCFSCKSFKSLAMSIFLFSLFYCFSFSFCWDDFVFWLALFNWSAGYVEYFYVFHSVLWKVFQDFSYVFLFRRQDFCYNHMTSQPIQSCFLFICSCNYNLIACFTSFFTLSGKFYFHLRDHKFLVTWLTSLKNGFLTLKLTCQSDWRVFEADNRRSSKIYRFWSKMEHLSV